MTVTCLDWQAAAEAAAERATSCESELTRLRGEMEETRSSHSGLVEAAARLTFGIERQKESSDARATNEVAWREELETVTARSAAVEARLEALRPEATRQRAEAARLAEQVEQSEAALQRLYSRVQRASTFATRAERDAHLAREIERLKASVVRREEQARM